MSESGSFRERLSGDLDARYEKLLKVIDDGMSATQQVWVTCSSCGKRTQTTVTDTRAALACAEFVSNQALGRPGVAEAESEESERIVFSRVVYLDDETVRARVIDAAEAFVPAEQLEDFLAACGLAGGA